MIFPGLEKGFFYFPGFHDFPEAGNPGNVVYSSDNFNDLLRLIKNKRGLFIDLKVSFVWYIHDNNETRSSV